MRLRGGVNSIYKSPVLRSLGRSKKLCFHRTLIVQSHNTESTLFLEEARMANPPNSSVNTVTPSHRICNLLEAASHSSPCIALGGHRGMGKNNWLQGISQYRENTIISFMQAVQNGASFVELDVQITKDGHAVIWHDHYIVYGTDYGETLSFKISDLTLAQWKALSPLRNMFLGADQEEEDLMMLAGASPESTISVSSWDSNISNASLMRQARHDLPAIPGEPTLQRWQVHKDDHLPTLSEVLEALPEKTAVDIELKMTTPHTMPRTPPEEVDRVVTAALAAVEKANFDWPSKRVIIYSSFDPDVCLELKQRRPHSQVMFLSDGGDHEYADLRRSSVSAAIDFAFQSGLQGCIFETAALEREPGAAQRAIDLGLRVMTYGVGNNNVSWVMSQQALGVHGVIVDDVFGVASGLGFK